MLAKKIIVFSMLVIGFITLLEIPVSRGNFVSFPMEGTEKKKSIDVILIERTLFVFFFTVIVSFYYYYYYFFFSNLLPLFSGSRKADLFESNDATSFRLKSLLRLLQRELNFFHCDFLLVLSSLLK